MRSSEFDRASLDRKIPEIWRDAVSFAMTTKRPLARVRVVVPLPMP